MRGRKLTLSLLVIVSCWLLSPPLGWTLPGDLDRSGRVDGYDLILFGRAQGTTQGDPYFLKGADLNEDGNIDNADLAILSAHFGRTGAAFGVWLAEHSATTATKQIVRVDEAGNVVNTRDPIANVSSLAGNPADGTIWLADRSSHALTQLDPTGSKVLKTVSGIDPYSVVVNPATGEVWATALDNKVYRFAADLPATYDIGTDTGYHAVISGFNYPDELSVNPITADIWVADKNNNRVVRLDGDVADGYDLSSDSGSHQIVTGFSAPTSVAVNSSDGTVWVADTGQNAVVNLDALGRTELHRLSGVTSPRLVRANYMDGSVWVLDGNSQLVRFAADGSRLFSATYNALQDIGVDPLSGNAWLSVAGTEQLIKLSPSGSQMLVLDGHPSPGVLTVMPSGGDMNRKPAALAVPSAFHVDINQPILFTGIGTDNDGTIILYEWDFDGDGTVDYSSTTSGVVSHAYPAMGIYTPVFRVTDNDRLQGTDQRLVIRVGALKASAAADTENGPAPLEVNFTGTFIDPIDGFVSSYQWDFDGDGTFDSYSETTAAISHRYNEPGTYLAKLKITDGPYTATDTVTITVQTSAPTATATADPVLGGAPLTVNLLGSGGDNDGFIVLYEWDFDGDGTYDWFSNTSGNTSHTYTVKGTYDAQLRLTDNDGLTATDTVTIEVGNNPPVAVADAAPLEGHAPLAVHFSTAGSQADGTIALYEWDFDNDGTIDFSSASTGETDHTYDTVGTYTATLKITDGNGVQASAPVAVKVLAADTPTLSVNADTVSGIAPLTVNFTANGSDPNGSIAQYHWNFGEDYVWVVDRNNNQVVRLYGDGSGEAVRVSGFNNPTDVAANAADGTVWVADSYHGEVIKLAADGRTELLRLDGFSNPLAVAANQADGSVWVIEYYNGQVVKLAADGTELVRVSGFNNPMDLVVNSVAGEVWVTNTSQSQVVRLAADVADGYDIGRDSGSHRTIAGFSYPYAVAVNSVTGTVWVTDRYNYQVVRLAADVADGYDIGRDSGSHRTITGFSYPYAVAVNPAAHTVWVTDYYYNPVVRLAADVTDGYDISVDSGSHTTTTGVYSPSDIAVNTTDNTVWMTDNSSNQVVKLAADGTELTRLDGFSSPIAVSTADSGAANNYTDSQSGNTSHTYTVPGIFHAVCTVTDNDGNTVHKSVNIRVYAVPSVTAQADVSTGSAPLTVFLSGAIADPDGTIVRYEWDFDGDGTYDYQSTNSATVRHLFPTAGTYNAMLRVTDNDGLQRTDTVTVTVNKTPPTATAKATPLTGNAPLTVNFNGTGDDPDGTVALYEWDFTSDSTYDFSSAASGATSHTYNTAGTYTATLRVTDNDGLTATAQVMITVNDPGVPTALLYATPPFGATPHTVAFCAGGLDADGTITSYELDYDGDGTYDFSAATAPTVFADNMESGAGLWGADTPWALTSDSTVSDSTFWTESPGGNSADNLNASLTSVTIDLSSAVAPKLIFWHRYDFKSGDYGRVEISGNGGSSWTRLGQFTNATQSSWTKQEYSLASYAGNATVKIRFQAITNATDTGDGWSIDNVWAGDCPSHTYAPHGIFPATLRVTDNDGKQATATTTISAIARENRTFIWVADQSANTIVKLADDGTRLATISGFYQPRAVDVDPGSGNVWVADYYHNQVVKLAANIPDGRDISKVYTADTTANGNDGFLAGDTVAASGQLNGGMNFDGSNDYIRIADNSMYRMASWTMEAWIKPASFDGINTIVGKVSQSKDFALLLNGDKIGVMVYSGGRKYLLSTTPAVAGQWYHVAGVYDSTVGMLRLYIDGALVDEAAYTPDTSNTDPLLIGRSYCCSGEAFNGVIDEVRIWNTARTAQEIADHKDSELSGSETGLVGYWPLNGTSSYYQAFGGFNGPYDLSVDSTDGSVWVADYNNQAIVKLAADGTELARFSGVSRPQAVKVDAATGVVWIADTNHNRIIRLNTDAPQGYIIPATKSPPDASANTNNGWLMGDASATTGKLAGGIALDGNGDYIVIPNDPALDVASFTVEAWVKNDYGGGTIFSRSDGSGYKELYLGFANNTTVTATLDNGTANLFSGTTVFSDGSWHHIALTYDGATLSCYVDGALYGTPVSLAVTLDFAGSHALIGARYYSFNSYATNFLGGSIDDLRLWNVARSASEIAAAMNSELIGNETGLVGYWPLNSMATGPAVVTGGFSQPVALSSDPVDNSVWVADHSHSQIVKLNKDGNELYRVSGFNRPSGLAVDRRDRSVWVADTTNDQMVKLAANSTEIFRLDGFNDPQGVAVDGKDGSVWVADYSHSQVAKLAPNGTELLRLDGFTHPIALAVDSATRNLLQPPTATAAAGTTGGDAPLPVSFTGSATDDGTIVDYQWDFDGDGTYDFSSAASGNATHTYTGPGTYYPVFKVTDDDGMNAFASTAPIYVGPLTVTGVTASPSSGNAALDVTLTGTVRGLAAGVGISRYAWDFEGDGAFDYTSADSARTTHTYTYGGTYTPILRVTDENGHIAFGSATVVVMKRPPTAYNFANPTTGSVPLAVTLNGSGNDPDGSVVRYEWDYDGDGVYDWFSETTGDTSFSYKTVGTYAATLRVTDNDGLSTTASKTITVNDRQDPPVATATADVTEGASPLTVHFTGSGNDPDKNTITLYEWDLDGNGVFETSSAVSGAASFTYTSAGIYTVAFRVTDSDGLTDTAEIQIKVRGAGVPVARASADPTTGEVSLDVNFSAAGSADSDGSIVQYDWAFGDETAWVADYYNNQVKRINGYLVDQTRTGFYYPVQLAINQTDGTVWVSDQNNAQVVKLTADGSQQLARISGFNGPEGLCIDETDGSVWVADKQNGQVVKLDSGGTEQQRISGFRSPTSVGCVQSSGQVWVADSRNNRVVHLDKDGRLLAAVTGFNGPYWISVDQANGRVWVANQHGNNIIRLEGDTPDGYNLSVAKVTTDTTAAGNTGLLFDNTVVGEGMLAGGASFDGSGDYIQLPASPAFDVQNFTVEAWIKSSSVGGRALFMRGNSAGGNELYIGFSNNSTVEAFLDNGSANRFAGATNFADNTWHHVALTYDGATLSCYVDGALYGTPVSLAVTLDFGGSLALIGADFDTFNAWLGNYFKGQIDDVRFWNVARTESEIAANKDSALSGNEAGLIGYWKLDTLQDTPFHKAKGGFSQPLCTSVNPLDHSVWVCDFGHDRMVRISADTTREIVQATGFRRPRGASVNPADGSVWVADTGNNQIVKLDSTGHVLRRLGDFYSPRSVATYSPAANSFRSTTDGNANHTYTRIGEYVATLKVTDNDGNTDTDSVNIKTGVYPKSLPTVYPNSGTAPLTVRFSANGDSPSGTIEYFNWDFNGNGTTDWSTRISENNSYTYQQPGTYIASQTVIDNRGLSDTATVTITVLPASTAPQAKGIADPPEGTGPLAVDFNGFGKDSDGFINKFEWDFDNDGTYDFTSTTTGSTSHTYDSVGLYTAMLRVTDNDGNTGLAPVQVEVKENGAPTAAAAASPTSGEAALEVAFTGSGTDDGTIAKYEWDFDGDGVYDYSSTTSGDTTHTYTKAGSYNAVLRVTDNDGKTDTDDVNVVVSAGISANLDRDVFDPLTGGSVGINSILTTDATITLLIKDRIGTPVRTLVDQAARGPGFYTDYWDGKDDNGQVMDSGVYFYVIEYTAGGESLTYDLTNNVVADRYTPSTVYPESLNPLSSETSFFRYTLDTKSEVTIYVAPFSSGAGERIKTIVLRIPQKAGNYVQVWDGTDDNGDLAPVGNYVIAVMAWRLPENAIIVASDPEISDLLVRPTYLNPAALPYDSVNTTTFTYTLSKTAAVKAYIINSDNRTIKTVSLNSVPAGQGNDISWDGKDEQGYYVAPGIYRLRLVATDSAGNTSLPANALVRIFY